MSAALLPVQMLWVGGPLSTLERLSLTSFVRNGHEVQLYTYGRPANTPKGLVIKDAGEILPAPGAEGGAGFVERFRAKLLLERGGLWADSDVVCVKALEFAAGMEYLFASETLPAQPGDDGKLRVRACGCVIKAPPGSPVLRDLSELPETEATQPGRLHGVLDKFNLLSALLNPNVFCPVPFWGLPALFTGAALLPAECHGVLCRAEACRRNFFDLNGSYEPLSLYERLKTHYLGGPARKESA